MSPDPPAASSRDPEIPQGGAPALECRLLRAQREEQALGSALCPEVVVPISGLLSSAEQDRAHIMTTFWSRQWISRHCSFCGAPSLVLAVVNTVTLFFLRGFVLL